MSEIEIEFDSVGIARDAGYNPPVSGQRRSLVEQFYRTLDFTSPDDTRKLLLAYENILRKAVEKLDAMAGGFHGPKDLENARRRIESLKTWLERDGLELRDGRILSPSLPNSAPGKITEVTRRKIEDFITLTNVEWWGRFSPADFLARLYDLGAMPSHDPRYKFAAADIDKHTVHNDDWDAGWVFRDPRFDLCHCSDEDFVRFLAEVLHPVVRSDPAEVKRLVTEFNKHLVADGWRLVESGHLSEHPIYTGQRRGSPDLTVVSYAKTVAVKLNADYVALQIRRMEKALQDGDNELAIGTAKEFIETICKTILAEDASAAPKSEDIPQLVKLATSRLKLTRDDIPDAKRGADSIRVLLSNLAGIAHRLAELRSLYGTGHGKHAKAVGLGQRHARLAVGAATTLGVFLFETYTEREGGSTPQLRSGNPPVEQL